MILRKFLSRPDLTSRLGPKSQVAPSKMRVKATRVPTRMPSTLSNHCTITVYKRSKSHKTVMCRFPTLVQAPFRGNKVIGQKKYHKKNVENLVYFILNLFE